MSVVASKRGLSGMEFWKNIDLLGREIREIVGRDFGIKPRTREPENLARVYKMAESDREVLVDICQKYGIERVAETYPAWKLERYRNRLMDLVSGIKADIRSANDVYPYYWEEYIDRRRFQDNAIRKCGMLYDEFTDIKRDLPIKAEKYMSLVEKIEKERKLLKGWRKSDNHIARRLEAKKEAKGKAKKQVSTAEKA